VLEINGLSVRYGGIVAVDHIDLHVDEGEVVVVLGANGAGKTSLFRAICGSVPAASGEVHWGGADLLTLAQHRRAEIGVAHVPEGRHVFEPLTVEENLLVGAGRARDAKGRLPGVYDLFPMLRDKRAQRAGQLSGGQQQMVALGRALMARPRLLLIDEPSMGLAPSVVTEVFDRIASINSTGTAVLLVEQRADEALDIADRGYVLERGVIVADGSGEQLRNDDRVRTAYLGAE
jgi:branched-chain amino acid transport system ATP-binding protein